MRKNTLFLLVACLMTISTLIGGCSSIQNKAVNTISKYPEKPITMIVPFSAGGGLDLTARALEKSATKYLGQPLAIINKPGAAGSIGYNEIAGANPDGYTIGTVGVDILLQSIYGPTKYNYITALDPIVQVSTSPLVLAVKSDQVWQNVDDLIEYAKQHPRELKYGHGGVGTINHLVSVFFEQSAGINIQQVPFRG
ncbi:MAG: tripartite tricarboxylate transporter substrate binding protein, partial [Veillonellales bacterium]